MSTVATLLPADWGRRVQLPDTRITVLQVDIASLTNPEVTERLDFLVDPRAVYSGVPAPVLARLGVPALREEEAHRLDGARVRLRIGGVLFKYGKRTSVGNVIFGEDGTSPWLGALTLEALGFALK